MKKKIHNYLCFVKDLLAIYLFNNLLWLDWGLNVVLGGRPGQTFSARIHLATSTWARLVEGLIDLLAYALFRETRHCEKAVLDVPTRRSLKEAARHLRVFYFNAKI